MFSFYFNLHIKPMRGRARIIIPVLQIRKLSQKALTGYKKILFIFHARKIFFNDKTSVWLPMVFLNSKHTQETPKKSNP